MQKLNRRHFIAAGTSAAAIGASIASGNQTDSVAPPPQVPLGKTGITLSRVGQGTGMTGGNRQSNHTRMGFKKFTDLLRHSYDRGITFFDMADLYGTHIYFREVLKSIPREKVAILTKLWWRYDGSTDPKAESWRERVCSTTLERFRHELSTDYLDIVLLHCLMKKDWPQRLEPYMNALSAAKDKGQVKSVGVSCHHLDALRTAAECPWVDVILARINPRGVKMDGKTEEVVPVLETARKNGKAIIGMKILGEGQLVAQRDECMRFAQESGLLDTMTIGFEAQDQVDEALRLIHKYPTKPLV
jgi:aryl-alcohol dehydrogenase-like predicted oxidoreductase